jgi:hypothetical protein
MGKQRPTRTFEGDRCAISRVLSALDRQMTLTTTPAGSVVKLGRSYSLDWEAIERQQIELWTLS